MTSFSSSDFLMTCPNNFACLVLIVFNRCLSIPPKLGWERCCWSHDLSKVCAASVVWTTFRLLPNDWTSLVSCTYCSTSHCRKPTLGLTLQDPEVNAQYAMIPSCRSYRSLLGIHESRFFTFSVRAHFYCSQTNTFFTIDFIRLLFSAYGSTRLSTFRR